MLVPCVLVVPVPSEKSSAWHSSPWLDSQTAGERSTGLKPMNSMRWPETRSPIRRSSLGASSDCRKAATDKRGSLASLTLTTRNVLHGGANIGSTSCRARGGTLTVLFVRSGPVMESNALRARMAAALACARMGDATQRARPSAWT